MATESFSAYNVTGNLSGATARTIDTGTTKIKVTVSDYNTSSNDAGFTTSWGNDLRITSTGGGSQGRGGIAKVTHSFYEDNGTTPKAVTNYSFTLKDIDCGSCSGSYQEQIRVVAYDLNGNILPDSAIQLNSIGSNVATHTAGDGMTFTSKGANVSPTGSAGSATITLTGPVARFEIFSTNLSTTSTGNDYYLISPATFNPVYTPPLDGIVEGTAGGDLIDFAYNTDPDGDRIDNNDNTFAGVAAGGAAGSNDDLVQGFGGSDTIKSGAGNDTVYAGTGADSVDGGDGNDVLYGYGDTLGAPANEFDNDTLIGGLGNDKAYGGAGNDVLYGDDTLGTSTVGGNDYLDGGDGNDSILGGGGNDTIVGGGGTDTLLGGAGNDSIFGDQYDPTKPDNGRIGPGAADWIDGGDGNDTIYGGLGNDTLYGGAGADNITGNYGNDLIHGGDGNDTIGGGGEEDGTGQNDTIYGEGGDDSIDANIGNDLVYGGIGNDLISGGAGNDTVSGEDGNDRIYGNEGNDLLDGGAGDDSITGGNGSDTILGGAGNDSLVGSPVTENDTIDGGDSIDGGTGADTIRGGYGKDTLLGGDGTDLIYGGFGDDSITGGNGNDVLHGDAGQDTISVGAGDQANGGADQDTFKIDPTQTGIGNGTVVGGESVTTGVDYDVLNSKAVSSGVNVNFTSSEAGTLTSGTTTYGFSEIEHVVTGAGADTVNGAGSSGGFSVDTGAGNDTITGSAFNDTIVAGAAADTINGGAGNDSIDLGANDGVNDVITLQNGSGNDSVSGFKAPTDTNGDGLADTRGDQFDVSTLLVDPNDPSKGTVTAKDLLNGTGSVTSTNIGGVTGTLITFPNGETVFLPGVSVTELDTARELFYAGIPCFARGTLIETARGPVAIEALVAGDMIVTRDNGLQPIRWIGSRGLTVAELAAAPDLRPIRIAAGALGGGLPLTDLVVSPQHRVLVRSNIAQKMFGTREVLVAAKQLCQIDGIDIATDMATVEYFHMLFDQHEVVISNGAETESLYTGPEALKSVGRAARDEIFAIFPELRDAVDAPVAARPLVSGRMGRKLAVRHVQNHKPLNG